MNENGNLLVAVLFYAVPPPGNGSRVVSVLAVAVDVQPFALLLFRYAQANGHIRQFVTNKGDNARPDDSRQDNASSEEPRSGAVRQDSAAQQPAPEGVSWMAPGESVTDYIKRLDKSLLQPNRGGAVRQ